MFYSRKSCRGVTLHKYLPTCGWCNVRRVSRTADSSAIKKVENEGSLSHREISGKSAPIPTPHQTWSRVLKLMYRHYAATHGPLTLWRTLASLASQTQLPIAFGISTLPAIVHCLEHPWCNRYKKFCCCFVEGTIVPSASLPENSVFVDI